MRAAYRGGVRLKFLLRPGWIALVLLVAVFSALCFTLLAPWQFGRDRETETRNAAIQSSFQAAPRPLEEVLPGQQPPDVRTEWTKVHFHGRYLPQREVLAWLRTVQGEPAIEVLTPFRLDDGRILLVDRGFVRPVHGTDPPPFAAAPTEPVTLTARVRADETDSDHRPAFQRGGHLWTYAVDSRTVGAGTDTPLRPGYFALTDGQPGGLNPLPLPQLQSGPYFSYALQWIVFGIMAPGGVVYLVYNEVRYPRDRRGRPVPAEAAAGRAVAAEPDRPDDPGRLGGTAASRGAAAGRRPKIRTWGAKKRSVAQAIAEEEQREQAERAKRATGHDAEAPENTRESSAPESDTAESGSSVERGSAESDSSGNAPETTAATAAETGDESDRTAGNS